MDVDENGGLFEGYELKLNSYDLGVDIELPTRAAAALRAPRGEGRRVTQRQGPVFCAGANIRMLAGSTARHKVNFCKFTNETRNGIEDASANSGQRFIAASTAPRPAAATSWRSPAITSCWSTTAPPRCRCPRCRCSACCPAPAG
jgi:hypothetical protein